MRLKNIEYEVQNGCSEEMLKRIEAEEQVG